MNKYDFFVIIGWVVVSALVMYSSTEYVRDESILVFLIASPTLIGILLAGVLSSLAIIFAIIGSNEMIRIKELENINNNAQFEKISNNLRQDVYFILASFIITTLLSIFYIKDSYCPVCIGGVLYSLNILRWLFVLISTVFIISCIATYDIINGLFYILKFKYDLSNQKNN
jgi:hypothetical protein